MTSADQLKPARPARVFEPMRLGFLGYPPVDGVLRFSLMTAASEDEIRYSLSVQDAKNAARLWAALLGGEQWEGLAVQPDGRLRRAVYRLVEVNPI